MAKKADPKTDALADAMAALNATYGKNTVMVMGEMPHEAVPVISTGSLGLDAATGIGGIPRGRVTEIFGPEASGKTTIALHAIADAQRQGLKAAMVDAEHALDPGYAANLGVDVGALLLNQPSSGEEGLEVVDRLVATNQLGVIVIDSVAALVPQAEIDGDMGKIHIGLQARLMSHALRKLTSLVSEAGTACIFINQLREKVGIVFGNPETTPGGRALKFYASLRLDARGTATIKTGTAAVGRRTKVKVVKNKLAIPFRAAEFDILFGEGISRAGELLDLGQMAGVLRKQGSHYFYGDHPLGNGRDAARNALRAEPALAAAIEEQVRKIGLSGLLGASADTAAPEVPDRSAMVAPDFTEVLTEPDG
jgi:recombination protein RecA